MEKKGSGRRIKRFKPKLGSQNFSCLTKSPEKPRAIHRGVIHPKVKQTIFNSEQIDPKNIVIVKITKNIVGHKRMPEKFRVFYA